MDATAFRKDSVGVVGRNGQNVEIVPSRHDRKFVLGVLLVFASLSVFSVLRHEMWRDELHTWSVTLRSGSILRLFQILRYEGHGALWYLLLYPLTRMTPDPRAMQILHVGLATAAAGILLRFLPLPPLARVLVVFGYFPFFEYATISRDYAIGFLLVVAFCAVATQRPDALLLEALLLILLAQTNAYGVILAVSLAMLPVARLVGLARSRGLSAQEKKRAAVACLLFAAALVIAIKQLIPPPDGGFNHWFFSPSKKQLVQTLSTPWRGLVPVPKIQLQFWNTNFLDKEIIGSFFQASLLQAVLGTVLCLLLLLMHARRPAALLFFCFAYGGLLLFSYTKYLGDLRHHGHFWVSLLAAQWLWVFSGERSLPVPLLDRVAGSLERQRYRVILTLAVVGFAVGLGTNATDVVRTFSTSGEVARFLQAHYPLDTPVVGDRNYIAEAVATRLNRPFFYTMGERWGTFVIFDQAGCKFSKPEDVARDVERLRDETHRDVLILLNYPAAGPLAAYEEVARYPAGIVADERYFLYVARQASPQAFTQPAQSRSGDAHTLGRVLRVGLIPRA